MKHLACFVGIVVITTAFWLFAAHVEIITLDRIVEPPAGVRIEQWIDVFKHWAKIGIGMAGIASLLWYVFGQCVFKIDNWRRSGKRLIWLLFFLLPIAFIIVGIYYTRHAQRGAWLAYVWFTVNGSSCYYFATALCSPSSFKYTPWLARQFWRKLW